jgi:hypothetical protein
MGKPIDLVQGTLDLLILRPVSPEPRHGWAIAKRQMQVELASWNRLSAAISLVLEEA